MNMFINEVRKITGLTKKAIEYYVEQELISPCISENGYRNFTETEIYFLKQISVLRKLGISTEDIKAVLDDKTGEILRTLSVQQELNMQRQRRKKAALDKLSCGISYELIAAELKAIEQNVTIIEKLLDAFPGYYGRFVCLHFSQFLDEAVITADQQSAYDKIVFFLDNVPKLNLTEELQDYLIESTKHINTQNMSEMIKSMKLSIENPEEFISTNKEILDEYLAYKQSNEYKNSPVFKIQALLKEFNQTSGYYDVLIPMMKQLSSSYAYYCSQMEIANEKLLAQYPDATKLSDLYHV